MISIYRQNFVQLSRMCCGSLAISLILGILLCCLVVLSFNVATLGPKICSTICMSLLVNDDGSITLLSTALVKLPLLGDVSTICSFLSPSTLCTLTAKYFLFSVFAIEYNSDRFSYNIPTYKMYRFILSHSLSHT